MVILARNEPRSSFCPDAVAIYSVILRSPEIASLRTGSAQTGILPSAKTGSRRPTGLYGKSHAKSARRNHIRYKQNPASHVTLCALPTWWFWRGGCTRSHSEHGRETPQRRWYFVLRHGRVGRCQVCKTQNVTNLNGEIFAIITKQPATSGKTNRPPQKRPFVVLEYIRYPGESAANAENSDGIFGSAKKTVTRGGAAR